MASKQKRVKLVPLKTNLFPDQAAFVESIVAAGKAINNADALRYIVTAAIEKRIIKIEQR